MVVWYTMSPTLFIIVRRAQFFHFYFPIIILIAEIPLDPGGSERILLAAGTVRTVFSPWCIGS